MEKMNFFDKSSEAPILKNKSDLAQKLNGRVEPAFGIDLGTTNSAISVIINNNKPEPIILTSGKKTMPSCVLWNGSKQGFIVGEEAYKRINEVEHCVITQSNVRCRILTTQEHLAMVVKALQCHQQKSQQRFLRL